MTLPTGAILVTVLVGGMAAPASAGAPLYWDARGLLGHQPDAIVAAVTVADAVREMGTNAEPPVVELRIDTVLRGTLPQRQVKAVWWAELWSDDTRGPSREWSSRPALGPAPGDRLIVSLVDRKGVFDNVPFFRFVDTPEKRAEIRGWVEEDRRARLQMEREIRAARRALDARVRAWRNGMSSEAIARSARAADFVGVGHVVSGPNDGIAGFVVDKVLKGVPRFAQYGRVVVAAARLPAIAEDLVHAHRDTDFLLFFDENGKDLDWPAEPFAAFLPAGLGVVLADAAALTAVRNTLAEARHRRPPPFCVVASMGRAEYPTTAAQVALLEQLGRTFVRAGGRRCSVGTATLPVRAPTDRAAQEITRKFRGVAGAVFAAGAADGTIRLAGARIAADGTARSVFTDETWPATEAEQDAVASRILETLAAP